MSSFFQWLRNLFGGGSQQQPQPPVTPAPVPTPPPVRPTPQPAPVDSTPPAPVQPPEPVPEPTPEPPPVAPAPVQQGPATISAIETADLRVPLSSDVAFQIITSPVGQYADCKLDLSASSKVSVVSDIDPDSGRFTLRFDQVSTSDNDIQTIRVHNPQGDRSIAVTVSLMKLMWKNHPGRTNVCDDTVFTNQCAIRMGTAMELSGIKLSTDRRVLRRCTTEYNAYKDHAQGKVRGHVLAAQELANWIKSQPNTFGSRHIVHSKEELLGRTGIIFFRDGWGATDHIDVWDGESLVGGFPSYFNSDFKELWFWDIY
jgi:hypothetical protein